MSTADICGNPNTAHREDLASTPYAPIKRSKEKQKTGIFAQEQKQQKRKTADAGANGDAGYGQSLKLLPGGFLPTLENNIHLQNPKFVMVQVVCPHCQSEVTIDPDAGIEFTCMRCSSNFQYEQDEASTDLSPGTLWLSSNLDTENEYELMDGQKAHTKGLGWFVGLSALFLIPFTILGGAAGFFSCFIFVAGSAAMAAFFSQTGSHEGLYYNTSTGMLTLISTNEHGFWYVDKQVHKDQISSVEVHKIWLGEHQGSKLVLKIRGNGWVETMHAHGFNSKLFEELVGMEVQHKQAS